MVRIPLEARSRHRRRSCSQNAVSYVSTPLRAKGSVVPVHCLWMFLPGQDEADARARAAAERESAGRAGLPPQGIGCIKLALWTEARDHAVFSEVNWIQELWLAMDLEDKAAQGKMETVAVVGSYPGVSVVTHFEKRAISKLEGSHSVLLAPVESRFPTSGCGSPGQRPLCPAH